MRQSCARAVACVGICLGSVSSLPVAGQGSAGPIKSVFGVYGQPTSGHDSIRVTEKSGGQIGVNLKLYYSNGHTCQMNLDGKWSQDHVAVTAEGLDANRPCRLNVFFKDRRVVLKDDGFECAPVYCGTRGKLDNVSLSKFSPNRK